LIAGQEWGAYIEGFWSGNRDRAMNA
jgi:hypothetical protein